MQKLGVKVGPIKEGGSPSFIGIELGLGPDLGRTFCYEVEGMFDMEDFIIVGSLCIEGDLAKEGLGCSARSIVGLRGGRFDVR
jgi:hypothetical protein